jgi:hypothetical protein
MRAMKTTVTLLIAALALTACDQAAPVDFDPTEACDVLLASGYEAKLPPNAVAEDVNLDGLVVICTDPGTLESVVSG